MDKINKDEEFEYGILDQIVLAGILIIISPVIILCFLLNGIFNTLKLCKKIK